MTRAHEFTFFKISADSVNVPDFVEALVKR